MSGGPHVSQWGPIVKGTPCTCWEHRGGAPREIGDHRYVLEESDRTFGDGVPWPQWRAACPCGRGRPTQWQSQSDSVAYHAWRKHVEKYS